MEIEVHLKLALVVDTYEVRVNRLVVALFASLNADRNKSVKQQQRVENSLQKEKFNFHRSVEVCLYLVFVLLEAYSYIEQVVDSVVMYLTNQLNSTVSVVDSHDHCLSIVVIAVHYSWVVVESTSIVVVVLETSKSSVKVTNTVVEMKDVSLMVDENFPTMLNNCLDWY